jgi:hypothetical protein
VDLLRLAIAVAQCAISRFGPTRFPDLGPTFREVPAEPSERMLPGNPMLRYVRGSPAADPVHTHQENLEL